MCTGVLQLRYSCRIFYEFRQLASTIVVFVIVAKSCFIQHNQIAKKYATCCMQIIYLLTQALVLPAKSGRYALYRRLLLPLSDEVIYYKNHDTRLQAALLSSGSHLFPQVVFWYCYAGSVHALYLPLCRFGRQLLKLAFQPRNYLADLGLGGRARSIRVCFALQYELQAAMGIL